ncbi:LysM peptidoglycan-binding domain-containing protein [candidate division WOR-3 bacterium]|nr:LysM peptidoglycan-binding domain-containing protein [candidate division WOR-3 bacterium]
MKSILKALLMFAFFSSVITQVLTGLTHTVKLGETLTSISRMYGVSVSRIKDANNLSSDMIVEGQRLSIPSNSSGTGDLYVVKSGETLSGLARRFETTVEAIKRANGLSSDLIREGQRLAIPGRYPPPSQNNNSGQSRPPVNLNIIVPPEEKMPRPIVIDMSIVFPAPSMGAVEQIDTATETGNVYNVLNTAKTELIQSILNSAISYLGSPYVYGATGEGGFDCSGLVYRVYADNGIDLPRTVTDMESAGIEAPKDSLMPGDILIFEDPKHAGIYLGSGRFIHSSSYRNRGVIISSLERESYSTRFVKARRIVF